MRYVVNEMQRKSPAEKIIGFIFLMLLISVSYQIWMAVCDDILIPLADRRCEVRLKKRIYARSLTLDLADYENPSAFAQYNRAVNNGASAILEAVYTTCRIVSRVLKIGLTSWLMFTMDPVLLIFAVFPILSGFLRLRSEAIYHEQCVREHEISRRKAYVKGMASGEPVF